ncbi:MAG TPA: bifunctional glutamate N-acetyltransferase/amino-acid acetyltransferase ArgJ [Acidimicrobiia bacterium]|nr:bifunctional glutamate N-acetyltransferase/amino-acid acetyltransferase ArgJ [Acidimicrobiia bacterium]
MSVTAPDGFVAAGIAAGIKGAGRLDLAVVVAEDGAVPAAGAFTQNRAAAAPVVLSRRRLAAGRARAILLNSGCANAATGERGREAAETTTGAVAAALGCPSREVLAMSTGPIGSYLDIDSLTARVPELLALASREGGETAAEAILTTDSRTKTVIVNGPNFIIGGMAKGAAMLRPDMATMLAVLTTDAAVDASTLQRVLAEAAAVTFNSLNVDGCESTNDSLVLLASGRAGPASESELGEGVIKACSSLAVEMAADAEGASKTVRIIVTGAAEDLLARRVGKAVADSALVRASFYGSDPNWGRILAAIGTCPVDVDQVSISYQSVPVFRTGSPVEDVELEGLLDSDFVVQVSLGSGSGRAEIITTDLTPEYVRFNGERS